MTQDKDTPAGLWMARWIVALVLILVLYVLSYAPVMRLTRTHAPPPTSYALPLERWYQFDSHLYATRHCSYAPVRWVTAQTPLREPLLIWADLWGMRDIVESQTP